MGHFGRKTQYKIDELLPDESAKLEALYNLEVYPFIGGPKAPLLDITDQQGALWAAIQSLRRAAWREPYEFLWNFALGNNYIRLGMFADAVMVNERALALHPNDPRVGYALATCYRMLTRAAYSTPELREKIGQINRMAEGTGLDDRVIAGGKFDPDGAANELQKLGLTWENAAQESIKHFKKAMALGLSNAEIMAINTIIDSMTVELNQLAGNDRAPKKIADYGSMNIADLIASFSDNNILIRFNASRALEKIGEVAVIPLIQALKDSNSYVRESAAITLGHIKDARAVFPLIQLLDDSNFKVRSAVTIALVDIGEPAVLPLLEILNSRGKYVPQGQNFIPGYRSEIPKNKRKQFYQEAAHALGYLKDKRATQSLCILLKSKDFGDRFTAISALEEMSDPDSELAIIETLYDKNIDVRRYSLNALEKIGDIRALMPLINILVKDKEIQRFAYVPIMRILKKATEKDLRGLGSSVINDLISVLGNNYVWSDATVLLGLIDYPVIDTLNSVLHTNQDQFIRRRIPQVLAQRFLCNKESSDKILDILCETLHDSDKEVKINAVFALEKLKDNRAKDALLRATKDDDIRYYANMALENINKAGFNL